MLGASLETWHRRLGHINVKDLNKMRNFVESLDINDKVVEDKIDCVVCCEGKQSKLPFIHTSTRSNQILEIIHGDLCGPMEKTSIGGSRYYFILVDDFSRMSFVYFLKSKNEALKYLKEFVSMVKNRKGKLMMIFRSDQGGEFCNHVFERVRHYTSKNKCLYTSAK